MDDVSTLVALLAILLFALLSRRLERWWISMPLAMVVVGFAIGSRGIGILSVDMHSEIVKTTAELTLALMLFHDAVRIDLRALRVGYRIPLRLLGLGLPLMIVLGTIAAFGMSPTLGLVGAALLATMLAPTDAALGEAVVSDQRLPVAVRQGLNVESGLNDGLSVPIFLVLLAIAADPAAAESGALVAELLRQIGFGIVGGLLIGGFGGLLFRYAVGKHVIAASWRRVAVLCIAVGCFVCAAALGGSGFIGAFAGGIVFGLASEARSAADNALTGHLGTFLDALSFLMVGAMLLPFALQYLTWTGVLYAVLSLVVLRLASVVVAMLGSGARWPTLAFMGWFGPRGLATVVFTVLLLDEAITNGEVIASIAIICVVLSVFAHGLSAPPLVSKYSEWWHALADSGEMTLEGQNAAVHGLRGGAGTGAASAARAKARD
jgi:sodium/hydrogen antiporter